MICNGFFLNENGVMGIFGFVEVFAVIVSTVQNFKCWIKKDIARKTLEKSEKSAKTI
jgi:hypothetical protein